MTSTSTVMNPVSCENFRDAATSIKKPELLPPGRLFRGGKLDMCTHESLKCPKTIINLRQEPDEETFKGVNYLHFPKADEYDVYQAHDKQVQKWILGVIKIFEDDKLQYPVLVHCRRGKDRTGVIIAVLLYILGVPVEDILKEFSLSKGLGTEERTWIEDSINHFKKKGLAYWRGMNLKKIAENVRGTK